MPSERPFLITGLCYTNSTDAQPSGARTFTVRHDPGDRKGPKLIVCKIEYDPAHFPHRGGGLTRWDLEQISDAVETVAGSVFAIELEHVDVNIDPYDGNDEFTAPMFVTVEVEVNDLHRARLHIPIGLLKSDDPTAAIGAEFKTQLSERLASYFSHPIPFRLWVKAETGVFLDVDQPT